MSSLLASILVVAALAEEPTPPPEAVPAATAEEAAMLAEMQAFEANLKWQTGDVQIGGGLAALHLPATFRYLPPDDADAVLQAWGNPPSPDTLGMLFPADLGVFSDGGWALVLSYEADGHVDDADAASIDYGELLAEMQAGTAEGNATRESMGFPKVDLVGWAEPPHYDAATRKLYWAKELAFAGEGEHTVNYDVRVLGREGVLSMSAIATMGQLPMIRERMAEVITFAEFNPGNRYEDYDPSTDSMATYGIAGLVAGGAVAAKTGVLKGLLAMLLASKKLLVAGAVAGVAGLRAFFGGRKEA
jgi:uncharacterized membrane-anchored protein